MSKPHKGKVVIEISGNFYRIKFGNFASGVTQWHELDWLCFFDIINFMPSDEVKVRYIPKEGS